MIPSPLQQSLSCSWNFHETLSSGVIRPTREAVVRILTPRPGERNRCGVYLTTYKLVSLQRKKIYNSTNVLDGLDKDKLSAMAWFKPWRCCWVKYVMTFWPNPVVSLWLLQKKGHVPKLFNFVLWRTHLMYSRSVAAVAPPYAAVSCAY